MRNALRTIVAAMFAFVVALDAGAADIGQIKVARGQVTIERGGQALPAAVGARVQDGDTVKTGPDGSVGISMSDDSLLSAGPHTTLQRSVASSMRCSTKERSLSSPVASRSSPRTQ